MTRPIESDYTSQVAYTRALEAYCDTLAQLEQKPWVGMTDEEMTKIVTDIDVDWGHLLWKVVCLTKIIESELKEKNCG